jgi:hypothetical protein
MEVCFDSLSFTAPRTMFALRKSNRRDFFFSTFLQIRKFYENFPRASTNPKKECVPHGHDRTENFYGIHFIKHDIQGVFLKCAEILPTRL